MSGCQGVCLLTVRKWSIGFSMLQYVVAKVFLVVGRWLFSWPELQWFTQFFWWNIFTLKTIDYIL